MIEEMQKPRKAGRPKKKPTQAFVGFMPEDLEAEYFRMPVVWMLISAQIDNLAELKVVNYVIRHTYGYLDKKTQKPLYQQAKKITTDEFVHGRKRNDGSLIDMGTGLSDTAVKDGLARAIEHGLLTCIIDDTDKARVKKYYALKMQQIESPGISDDEENGCQQEVEVTDIFNDEDFQEEKEGGIINPSGGNNNPLWGDYQSYRSKNERREETLEEKTLRKTYPSKINHDTLRYLPAKGKHEGPLVIKQLMEDFSRDCGDVTHTGSNITRAYNMYQAAHVDPDAFLELLYAARDTARKASIRKVNSRGRPNRMPYLFTCLERSLCLEIIAGKVN